MKRLFPLFVFVVLSMSLLLALTSDVVPARAWSLGVNASGSCVNGVAQWLVTANPEATYFDGSHYWDLLQPVVGTGSGTFGASETRHDYNVTVTWQLRGHSQTHVESQSGSIPKPYCQQPTSTLTPTEAATSTKTQTVTLTETLTPVFTETPTPTATPTATLTPTETETPSQTPTATLTPLATNTPTVTLTPSLTLTNPPGQPSLTPTKTPNKKATVTKTSTSTTTRTAAASVTPTVTKSPTATITPTPTVTLTVVCQTTATPGVSNCCCCNNKENVTVVVTVVVAATQVLPQSRCQNGSYVDANLIPLLALCGGVDLLALIILCIAWVAWKAWWRNKRQRSVGTTPPDQRSSQLR